jgi:hypothetical protein
VALLGIIVLHRVLPSRKYARDFLGSYCTGLAVSMSFYPLPRQYDLRRGKDFYKAIGIVDQAVARPVWDDIHQSRRNEYELV